jgi:hypothetical protein
MSARGIGLLLLIALVLPAAGRPAAELRVELPPGPLLLGDRFELVVAGDVPEGASLVLEELPAELRAGRARREVTERGVRLVAPMRAVREGQVRLESLSVVAADGTLSRLPPVELQIELPLPEGRLPRVAEALPPLTLPAPRPLVWPLIVAGLVGLVLLGAWVIAVTRERTPAAEPVVPAHERAMAALARLRSHLPGSVEAVPGFIEEVSSILRAYIERRFAVRAPEETTEEFLAEVASRHDELAGERDELARFLQLCDLVKFARHRPPPTAVAPLLDTAMGVVERTRT